MATLRAAGPPVLLHHSACADPHPTYQGYADYDLRIWKGGGSFDDFWAAMLRELRAKEGRYSGVEYTVTTENQFLKDLTLKGGGGGGQEPPPRAGGSTPAWRT